MKIEASLADELRANRDSSRIFKVIISLKDSDAVKIMRGLGIEPTTLYHNIAAAAAEVTSAQIEALALTEEVTLIEADHEAEAFGQP